MLIFLAIPTVWKFDQRMRTASFNCRILPFVSYVEILTCMFVWFIFSPHVISLDLFQISTLIESLSELQLFLKLYFLGAGRTYIVCHLSCNCMETRIVRDHICFRWWFNPKEGQRVQQLDHYLDINNKVEKMVWVDDSKLLEKCLNIAGIW